MIKNEWGCSHHDWVFPSILIPSCLISVWTPPHDKLNKKWFLDQLLHLYLKLQIICPWWVFSHPRFTCLHVCSFSSQTIMICNLTQAWWKHGCRWYQLDRRHRISTRSSNWGLVNFETRVFTCGIFFPVILNTMIIWARVIVCKLWHCNAHVITYNLYSWEDC